ncbi:MAG: hypothetical protein KAR42_03725 [candidate division Zixibacteria bacterium]|nr:hypothetical protein [candidate division Zixibacteria bacterium]
MANVNDPVEGKGIWQQIDEWFGRRHRVFYFLFGVGITWVIVQFIFTPIVLGPVKDFYENQLTRRYTDIASGEIKIQTLTTERDALRDSLSQVTYIGVLLNTKRISVQTETVDVVESPLWGNGISCMATRYGQFTPDAPYFLEVKFDTCALNGTPKSDDSTGFALCENLHIYTDLNIGEYCPFFVLGSRYVLHLDAGTDSTLTLSLYEKRNQ